MTQPEWSWILQLKAEKLPEPQGEFFSALQNSTEWREPEGQGAGRLFLLTLLWRDKRVRRPAGPKPHGFVALQDLTPEFHDPRIP